HAPPPNTTSYESWRFDPVWVEPAGPLEIPARAPAVYDIHGAILFRDEIQPAPVASLERDAKLHWNLARKSFAEPRLQNRLYGDFDHVQTAPAEGNPTIETYKDTLNRVWTLRTWKLRRENFEIVSLGRETDKRDGHIVLTSVVPLSREDGA